MLTNAKWICCRRTTYVKSLEITAAHWEHTWSVLCDSTVIMWVCGQGYRIVMYAACAIMMTYTIHILVVHCTLCMQQLSYIKPVESLFVRNCLFVLKVCTWSRLLQSICLCSCLVSWAITTCESCVPFSICSGCASCMWRMALNLVVLANKIIV